METDNHSDTRLTPEFYFRSFLENATDGIVIFDSNLRPIEWNKAMERITGLSNEQIYCLSTTQLREIFDQIGLFLISDTTHSPTSLINSGFIIDRDISTLDGKKRYVQINSFKMNVNGDVLIVNIIRDNTIHWQREMQYRQSMRRLRSVYNNTIHSFILLDNEYNIIGFNRISYVLYKRYKNKSLRIGDSFLNDILEEEHQQYLTLFEFAQNDKPAHIEIQWALPDSRSLWFEIHISQLKDKGGQSYGLFLNSIDITRLKNAETEIKEALQKEQDLNKMKTQFISTVSHEFRTPLASIYSNAQLMQRYSENWDPEKLARSLNRIVESVKNMTSLLDGVSFIGKGLSGIRKYEAVIFNVIELCDSVISECLALRGETARVVFQNSFEGIDIVGDRNLLRHILDNLISNSLKYSPPDSLVILHLLEPAPGTLLFEVKDKGIGIEKSDIKHLFDPFFRCEGVESIAGTGLGLAIVKQCIDTYGGVLAVESIKGEGSTFFVSLPYTTPPTN